jgi:hypothetical protein
MHDIKKYMCRLIVGFAEFNAHEHTPSVAKIKEVNQVDDTFKVHWTSLARLADELLLSSFCETADVLDSGFSCLFLPCLLLLWSCGHERYLERR